MMNGEVYALQLIDEETGEVLKDVTPITESKSVIHDGEKLSEVLDLQRDKIQEQSKSNLVLVTTMQKLLSEKIEELETEKAIIENNPLNIVKEGRRSFYTGNGKLTQKGNIYIFDITPTEARKTFAINTENSKVEKLPIESDIVYTLIKLNKKVDLECHYNGDKYKAPVEIKEVDDGFLYLFEHTGITYLKETYKYMENEDLIIDTNVTVTINEKPMRLIKNDYRWGVTENLNFYKSQLEKLKQTQQVDLNLLLTL